VAVAVVGELLVAGGELLQALRGDGQFTFFIFELL